MISFVFTAYAEKAFLKLPNVVQKRITEKLKVLKSHPDIMSVLKQLHDFEPATHRLRIGDYRLILELEKQASDDYEFAVLDVGHRRDIYT